MFTVLVLPFPSPFLRLLVAIYFHMPNKSSGFNNKAGLQFNQNLINRQGYNVLRNNRARVHISQMIINMQGYFVYDKWAGLQMFLMISNQILKRTNLIISREGCGHLINKWSRPIIGLAALNVGN